MTDSPQFPRPHLTIRNEPPGKAWAWFILFALFLMVAFVTGAGWLLFTELTRCDPCEWVGLSAPLMGDW